MRASFSFLAFIIVIILLASFSFYTVNQYESALVLRLGKIVMNKNNTPYIATPGLHFRWPGIDTVDNFDMRIRTLESDSDRVMTAEQKEVSVDAYVKWKISDIVKYYKSTTSNNFLADSLLQQALQDAMRSQFGQMTINQLVDTKREAVMTALSKALQIPAAQLGIQIIDVRIKKIELPQKVQDSVFARMRSKRENDAASYRAQGLQAAEQIKADADAQAAIIVATARSQAAKIRAEGQAEAAALYTKSYSQAPEFYNFYRTLLAYQVIFSSQRSSIVLRPNDPSFQFFKYFNQPGKASS